MNTAHESIRHPVTVSLPSNRSFGIVFVAFFAIIALWPLLSGGGVRVWALVTAAAIALVTFALPSLLTLPNRWWMAFGALLHRFMSPLVLGVMFFAVITPFALVMRWAGRDALRRRADANAKSYWIAREPPGPVPESLDRQF